MSISNNSFVDLLPTEQSWPGRAARIHSECLPLEALSRLAHLPGSLLLHSAKLDSQLGRYSFLMADPYEWIEIPIGQPRPLESVRRQLARYQSQPIEGLPPFQGGLAGLLTYDLNRSLESIATPRVNDFELPAAVLGLYDVVIAWDHYSQETWIVSQGFPELDDVERTTRAESRLNYFCQQLNAEYTDSGFDNIEHSRSTALVEPYSPYQCPGISGLTSNFDNCSFEKMIDQAINYIYEGDIYQVNLAQRLLAQADVNSLTLFKQLCECNAAPFAGWFDIGSHQIVSCSPERLVSLRDRTVETRPIKGTRRRTRVPQVDIEIKRELESSEKDRAENVMIVDLMRNDLSKVCDDDSVQVRQLLQIEAYESVFHLVSAVEGKLRDGMSAIDLIEAVFPGGSITGAPKIRAMEVIAELEPTARGAYCGSLGYIGFDGTADWNILIRTITAGQGYWQIPVGGGIVAQSNPKLEYEETWTKAAGLLQGCVKP